MHGRLKVRSTQEQEERKRIEREKKLEMYKYAMSKCVEVIANKDFGNPIACKLSEELLSANGDISTLWNLRKDIVEYRLEQSANSAESDSDSIRDQLAKMFVNELQLTEQALKKNPKSYGSWHHRQWCLKKANSPALDLSTRSALLSWSNELQLCNVFLNLDERNFHCWKHRFFVVDAGHLFKLSELEYTYEKICANFSNYSSWHYRSKLIECLYSEAQVDSDIFKRELDLIENALFTDPNDQSAWIYEKWLLLEHRRSFIKSLRLDVQTKRIVFEFFRDFHLNEQLNWINVNNSQLFSLKWVNESSEGSFLVWSAQIDQSNEALIKSTSEHAQIRVEMAIKSCAWPIEILMESTNEATKQFAFRSKFEIKNLQLDKEMIEKHLANIEELSQLESGQSKWCLLTSVELMSMINYDKYKEKIGDYLNRLASEIDMFRSKFYMDLSEKLTKVYSQPTPSIF